MPIPLTVGVNAQRFRSTVERSAEVGRGREGGLPRLASSDAGLEVKVDRVGNIFARRSGQDDSLPPVLLGSHLDTQANGGRFDGIVGVMGAFEVARTLDDLQHVTRRPLEIINGTNEEGARFSPPMLASGCFAGVYDTDWAHKRQADDGAVIGEELRRISYLGPEPVGGRELDSYFEPHIEQGSILDAERVQVGTLTHGYSSHGFLAEFHGETAHTGPWSMEKRRNALLAAARLLVEVDGIGWDFAVGGGKATAARLSAWPNKAGILSDWAQATCDMRHDIPKAADVMAERVRRAVGAVASRAGCTADILDHWAWGGRIFNDELISLVRGHAAALGCRHRDLTSQAGHDAYFLARICPTAMMFTPCRDGIAHHNVESAGLEDLEPSLNVLLHRAVSRADRR